MHNVKWMIIKTAIFFLALNFYLDFLKALYYKGISNKNFTCAKKKGRVKIVLNGTCLKALIKTER